LTILRDEIDRVMALLGCVRVDELNTSVLYFVLEDMHRAAGPLSRLSLEAYQ